MTKKKWTATQFFSPPKILGVDYSEDDSPDSPVDPPDLTTLDERMKSIIPRIREELRYEATVGWERIKEGLAEGRYSLRDLFQHVTALENAHFVRKP